MSHGHAAVQRFYPEREDARPGAADRLVADLARRWQRTFARQAEPSPLPEPPADLARLRYVLRRDGFTDEAAGQALSAACAALGAVPAVAVTGARILVRGAVAELDDAPARRQALVLAALARALAGTPVHWIAPTDRQAASAAAALAPALARLGLAPSAVRCATVREIAFDYLRDRLQLGPGARRLRGLVERLAGDGPGASRLRLSGLHCALVEDCDEVMLDEALVPLAVTAEPDLAGERLVLDQARELAQALSPETDFVVEDETVRLTPEGMRRLAQLSVLLGAPWSTPSRREALVAAALGAHHLGREPGRGADVLVRLTLPRFLNRYLHLSGACRDARDIEDELWFLYSLRTWRAGPAPRAVRRRLRVFATTAARRAALAELAEKRPARIALRTKGEAQALLELGVPQAALLVYPAHRQLAGDASPKPAPALVVGELHEGERQLAQLAQACGAAEMEVLLALEDENVRAALGPLARAASKAYAGELPPRLAEWLGERALAGAHRGQARLRRDLVLRERQLNEMLAFSGPA